MKGGLVPVRVFNMKYEPLMQPLWGEKNPIHLCTLKKHIWIIMFTSNVCFFKYYISYFYPKYDGVSIRLVKRCICYCLARWRLNILCLLMSLSSYRLKTTDCYCHTSCRVREWNLEMSLSSQARDSELGWSVSVSHPYRTVVVGSSDHFTDSDLWVSFSKMNESFFESFCSFQHNIVKMVC